MKSPSFDPPWVLMRVRQEASGVAQSMCTYPGGAGCREAKQRLLENVAPRRSPETVFTISDTSIRLQLMSPFNGVQASCRVMVLTMMHVLQIRASSLF